jgi:hypothetical protein
VKNAFIAGKTTGGAAHGGEKFSALRAGFRVRGNFGAAVFAEKTGLF